MASRGSIVFVVDDVIQRPLGSYPGLDLTEVVRGYAFRSSSVPESQRYLGVICSCWGLTGECTGSGGAERPRWW